MPFRTFLAILLSLAVFGAGEWLAWHWLAREDHLWAIQIKQWRLTTLGTIHYWWLQIRIPWQYYPRLLEQKRLTVHLTAITPWQKGQWVITPLIYRPVYARANRWIILGGTTSQFQPGAPVISQWGFVGILGKVQQRYAEVIPLLDKAFYLPVYLKQSQVHGLLHWHKGQIAHIEGIPLTFPLTLPDTVWTLASGRWIPPHLFVGIAQSAQPDSMENEWQVSVHLNPGLWRARYLAVFVPDEFLKHAP